MYSDVVEAVEPEPKHSKESPILCEKGAEGTFADSRGTYYYPHPSGSKRPFATVFPHSQASLTPRLTPFSANQST
jgi:hypothetical protein